MTINCGTERKGREVEWMRGRNIGGRKDEIRRSREEKRREKREDKKDAGKTWEGRVDVMS